MYGKGEELVENEDFVRLGGIVMVVLDDYEVVKSQSSSRGNQQKFYKDGTWIKLDHSRCHEGLAEDFVLRFCACIKGMSYVPYKSEMFMYHDEMYVGCFCPSIYWNKNIEFITLRSLLRQYNKLISFVTHGEIKDNIRNTILFIKESVGVDTWEYFARLIYLDSIILNEDRHIMNVGVCFDREQEKYLVAPCFDNGASLFCTNWTYRISKTLDENIKSVLSCARPFSKFFMKQVDAFRDFGYEPLSINKSAVEELLETYENKYYPTELVDRTKKVLQLRLKACEGVSFEWVM